MIWERLNGGHKSGIEKGEDPKAIIIQQINTEKTKIQTAQRRIDNPEKFKLTADQVEQNKTDIEEFKANLAALEQALKDLGS